ncbi:MAG TPA: SDR family NAD(P)-dependent oxidoreductase, partial [Phycisphaerales bacterium]|nr:SDR family NAD(P)-dependent oxidoreductase [Phycisphaerales bacterium]
MPTPRLLIVVSIALAVVPLATRARGQPGASAADPERAVLITGASTGIGRATTELLAANGFYVYAGARSEEDIAELSAIENVRGVRLDVTKPEDIAAAVETVRSEGRGL